MFGDKSQHDHMMSGIRKAATSPNTPAHLRAHLQKRLGGQMSGIHIKPENRGKFTAKANAAGKSVQQFANEKAAAGGVLGKEANFARMAKRGFKPLPKGGKKRQAPKPDAFYGE